MRLATLSTDDGSQAVALHGQTAVAIDDYADVGALLRAGAAGWDAARQAAANPGDGQPYEDAVLLRPVLDPGAIVCVGLNYRTHILEMGRELPTHPTLFSKLPRALTDPFADLTLPPHAEQIDYEGELAVVIGRAGRDVDPENAWEHVAGLTVMNDLTVRDFQRRTIQWFAGKTFQTSTPVGPALVTLDEIGDLDACELRVAVNGEERQRSLLGDLVFDVPALVTDLSRIVELAPGDIIATGTPGGVGEAQRRLLSDGDVVEVSIERIGTIRNTVRVSA